MVALHRHGQGDCPSPVSSPRQTPATSLISSSLSDPLSCSLARCMSTASRTRCPRDTGHTRHFSAARVGSALPPKPSYAPLPPLSLPLFLLSAPQVDEQKLPPLRCPFLFRPLCFLPLKLCPSLQIKMCVWAHPRAGRGHHVRRADPWPRRGLSGSRHWPG